MSFVGRVLIAGAGIGGLTLAVALRRRGIEAHVFERAERLDPLGAGITVQPNGFAVLETLALGDAVRQAGAVLRAGQILRADGGVLATMDTRAFGDVVGIHRAELHRVLLEVAGSSVELGFEVAGYEEDESGVYVRSADRRTVEGGVLVGADGLRSAVRAELVADGAPIYAGYTSWRGLARGVELPSWDRASESWGPGTRFGIVPIGGGWIYWFATANAPEGGQDRDRSELVGRFAEYHSPVRAILEATSDEAILRTDICDRDPIERWSRGRVTLLGDAAHPMTPNLGQGGCQAIEDAGALAAALAEESSVAEAFARYERARVGRANEIVRLSRSLGRTAQLESAAARFVRDLAIRLTPRWVMDRRMRATYSTA